MLCCFFFFFCFSFPTSTACYFLDNISSSTAKRVLTNWSSTKSLFTLQNGRGEGRGTRQVTLRFIEFVLSIFAMQCCRLAHIPTDTRGGEVEQHYAIKLTLVAALDTYAWPGTTMSCMVCSSVLLCGWSPHMNYQSAEFMACADKNCFPFVYNVCVCLVAGDQINRNVFSSFRSDFFGKIPRSQQIGKEEKRRSFVNFAMGLN